MALLALFILLGLWYRLSAVLFFLGFSYIFLLEQAQYLNHFYLVCLIAFIAIFLPANRAWALDAWRRPNGRSDWMPNWSLWLLRFQIGVPYFFGGLAKLNGDWLRAQPIESWLASRTDFSP
ncbi:MAG: HTTM domain-containing protein [Ardenticatenaceae bacterium]|nr:HTTM domain-containing protein [Ardenticatenaceae bacterium]